MEKFDLLAKTFQGLEEVLAKELAKIGAEKIEIGRRAVSFRGDNALLYKANLHCRTALRILKPIAVFTAKNAEEVYEKAKLINWEKFLSQDESFLIDATVYSDVFTHSKFVTYKTKDALVDYFSEKFGSRPSVKQTKPDIHFNLHISHTTCTLSLDSSGESLHKRGYRVDQTEAPINEVLAAGMILLTGWDGECNFMDPLCGSGTFLIEAAMIAKNIPSGIFRPSFAFERWKDFDEELFTEIYNDDTCEREFKHKILGSDISRQALHIAETNIKSAGLSSIIELQASSFEKLTPPIEKTIIVTNPPYGERMGGDAVLGLYERMGRKLKHEFTDTDVWIISSNMEAIYKLGLKPSVKIPLLNGGLPCEFRQYKLFSGTHKDYKTKLNK